MLEFIARIAQHWSMQLRTLRALQFFALAVGVTLAPQIRAADPSTGIPSTGRFLYVAAPGVRDYLEYGGHGILVFDVDHDHRFVRRIRSAGLNEKGVPLNIKGICANAGTARLYVSTTKTLTAYNLTNDAILWEKSYEGGCDRMSIAPDGSFIYLPSLEGPHWHVVEAASGNVLKKIVPNSGAHNTVIGLDGAHAYLAGLKSPLLTVTDTAGHQVSKTVGPFGNSIRPFTVNGAQTRCYVTVNELLGFEIGDLRSGKMLHRVEIAGFKKGAVKRHGCPSHGIGLTPDEKEIWVSDASNRRLHIFDNTVMPPKQRMNIELRDEPGWVTFSLDGNYAYPSTGEVIDARTKKILVALKDEEGRPVMSEKLLEIDFASGKPVRNGDQFGLGRGR